MNAKTVKFEDDALVISCPLELRTEFLVIEFAKR